MNRFAVLVDAGYLLSQSVQILSHQKSKSRKDISIQDAQGLITKLVEHAIETLGNQNLLRVYWYDGVAGRLSSEHEALSLLPDVQFRQGTISKAGQQKGVDSKIMVDLIELSTNQAISDAVLVTGDGDLVVGMEFAQRRGVRVGVLGIEDSVSGVSHNQSFEVVCAADRVRRMGKLDIAPFLSYLSDTHASAPRPAHSPQPSPAAKKAVVKKAPAKKQVASPKKPVVASAAVPVPKKDTPHLDELPGIIKQFIATANPAIDKTAVTPSGALGQALDARLLKAATEALGRKPMPSERTALRRLFKESL